MDENLKNTINQAIDNKLDSMSNLTNANHAHNGYDVNQIDPAIGLLGFPVIQATSAVISPDVTNSNDKPVNGTFRFYVDNVPTYLMWAYLSYQSTTGAIVGKWVPFITGIVGSTQIAFGGSAGALTGSSNLTWNGTTLSVNGKLSISGTIIPRVIAMPDATSFTPTGDTADINTQINTQLAGNLTANTPSGTPVDGQNLMLRIKSANVQTFIWNAIYAGSTTTVLPATTTGGGFTDKFFFQYSTFSSKWEIYNVEYGYA